LLGISRRDVPFAADAWEKIAADPDAPDVFAFLGVWVAALFCQPVEEFAERGGVLRPTPHDDGH
jgi:hypothetical protein